MSDTPEWRIVARGTPDTVVRRPRKGRTTYEVKRAHVRRMVGPDPVTGELVAIDHATLVDMADAWVRANDTSEHVCTCDDLTRTVLVLDRKTRQPLWHTAEQRYVTVERRVRRCHCAPFPPLLGLDGGRRNAWSELTPADMPSGKRTARVACAGRLRRSDPGEVMVDALGRKVKVVHGADGVARIVSPSDDGRGVFVGHEYRARRGAQSGPRRDGTAARAERRQAVRDAAPWATERAVIERALDASTDPEVTITDVPGVTITVRRNAGLRWKVSVAYGVNGETLSLRCKTVEPIARACVR